MQLVLLAAGVGSLYPLKQLGTGILLILLTLFNAVMGLRQEGKAAAAVAALQKMVVITARVRRDGQLAEIPAGQLVPGDIVAIEPGDIVPADGLLLKAASASLFNIAGGEPLLPLQTLWVSFTTLSIQSVGLGYSKPAAGLMERPPRPPSRPILTRGLIAWLAVVGLLMAIGTLGVISWADRAHGLATARTMGMVTFALFTLFFSIESKDERESAFSLGTFSDKTFVITTSVSFVLLVLSTILGIFQAVMTTTRLDVRQWLICAAVALSIVVAAEIRKAVRRRTAAM